MRRRARVIGRSLIRVALVAVGIGLLALCPGGMFPGSYAQDLLRLDHSVGVPRLRPLAPLPAGDLASSPGSPTPDLRFSTGSFHPIMRFVFDGLIAGGLGLGSLVSPDSSQSGPFGTSPLDTTVPIGTEAPGGGVGNRAAVRGGAAVVRPNRGPPAWRAISPGCSHDATESQLQTGGEFWSLQARSAVPVQAPAAVFTGSRRGSADPLGLGPAGHPVNLPAAGQAGSWCRPPPTPMSQSGPLVTRRFWILVFFPLGAFLVFLLSRGFRIRAIHETTN
jgi:hypothetical protein